MAGYLCLMPLASFCEIPLSDAYRHLLCKRSYLDASGIILLATPIFNLSSLIFHLDAPGIFFANGPILMPQASFCWLPLSFIFHL